MVSGASAPSGMASCWNPTFAAWAAMPKHIKDRAANSEAIFMQSSDVVGAHIVAQCKLCQHGRVDKPTYHHGDLKSALIAAAMAAVEQDGPDAVSLRDLAQSLGVSRAAPYRHFEDRDALLAAVAARGFEDLNAEYEAALATPGDGTDKLRAAGRAFFGFARRRPGLYRLMFQSDLLNRTPPPAVLIPPADLSYR